MKTGFMTEKDIRKRGNQVDAASVNAAGATMNSDFSNTYCILRTDSVGGIPAASSSASAYTLIGRAGTLSNINPISIAANSAAGRAGSGNIGGIAAAAGEILARLDSGNLGFKTKAEIGGILRIPLVLIKSTDTTTDISQAAFTVVPWTTAVLSQGIIDGYFASYTSGDDYIEVVNAGTYLAFAQIHCYSTVQRMAVVVAFFVDPDPYGSATQQLALGATGYIRSVSGHNHASLHLMEPMSLAAGDRVYVYSKDDGLAGTCTMGSSQHGGSPIFGLLKIG